MAPGESNGHVSDDVTWPERSRSWSRYIWMQISWKRLVIWSMTSCDLPCKVRFVSDTSIYVGPIVLNMAGDAHW